MYPTLLAAVMVSVSTIHISAYRQRMSQRNLVNSLTNSVVRNRRVGFASGLREVTAEWSRGFVESNGTVLVLRGAFKF